MKTIAITGIYGKTTVANILNNALVDQGFSTFLCSTWKFHHNKNIIENQRKRTTPTTLELRRHKNLVETCDFLITEASSDSLRENRFEEAFKSCDVAVLTSTDGYSHHQKDYENREQYLESKAMLFSYLKQSGIAVFPCFTEIKESIKKIAKYKRASTEEFLEFDPVRVANIVLRKLGLEESAKEVFIEGRYEWVSDNVIVDKANQEKSIEWVIQKAHQENPDKKIVVVFGEVFDFLGRPTFSREISGIIQNPLVEKAVLYELRGNHSWEYGHKSFRAKNREEAFRTALSEKENLILVLGNGDQPDPENKGIYEPDKELINRIIREE